MERPWFLNDHKQKCPPGPSPPPCYWSTVDWDMSRNCLWDFYKQQLVYSNTGCFPGISFEETVNNICKQVHFFNGLAHLFPAFPIPASHG